MQCAALGCEADPSKDADVALFRINPKGHRPFIGLCQPHMRVPRVELKPDMAALIESQRASEVKR
jgi:hypothetical protein